MSDHKVEPVFRGLQGTLCKACGKRVVRHRRGRYAGQWRHHAYPFGMLAHNRMYR